MYATQIDEATMAKARSNALPISFKQAIEICNSIRGKPYAKAVRMLEEVKKLKTAVPYSRFNRGGTGHKAAIGPGRYPVKASSYILEVVQSAYANARHKDFNLGALVIKAALARKGAKTPHYGRKRGRISKRTHLEIVLAQTAQKNTTTKKETKATSEK